MPQLSPQLAARKRLRVPVENGGILAVPLISEAAFTIETNQARLAAIDGLDLQGRTLGQMREIARGELIASAFRYTSELRGNVQLRPDPGPIVLTGHQPELFHPGVWVKNFAAARVAQLVDGTAINLVIDNDTCDAATVRVPVPTKTGLRFDRIPVDSPHPSQPWEERKTTREGLAGLGTRLSDAMSAWSIPNPVGAKFDFDHSSDRLADHLTRVRSQLEASRGVNNLELPISRLCQTEAFLRFVCHLLVNIKRFHKVHNEALTAYRLRNGLRSNSHPVPALEMTEGWWEAPFWSWREGDRDRKRLFVRQQTENQLHISDGTRLLAELPLGPGMDACCAAEVLMQLASTGERIRTRALSTTIFSRMLFSDLFIHGIGGAKYDEMTDAILSDFYGVEPPAFMTCSATLQLLGDRATDVTSSQLEKLQRQLRELKFQAEDWVDTDDETVRSLVAEKRALIAAERAGETEWARERYFRFREVNKKLAKHTVEGRAAIEAEMEALRVELQRNRLLRSRDLSFALFPPERLWSLFDSLAG